MLILFLAKLVIFRKEQELSKSNSNLKVKVNPNHFLKRLPKSVFNQLFQEIYYKLKYYLLATILSREWSDLTWPRRGSKVQLAAPAGNISGI